MLVGVAGYRRMPALPAVTANLRDLAAVLTDPSLGGLPADACTVLDDPESSSAVVAAVHEAAAQAAGLLVVYFAGHGLLDDDGELYLALPDGDRQHLAYAVRFGELRREVMKTARGCRAKLVVLDCCFSGRALAGFMGPGGRLAAHAAVEGAYLMTATAGTVAAAAPEGARHTAFTGALIETLRDGVPGGPAVLDTDTVFEAVDRALRARNQPIPQRASRSAGHRIPLVRNATSGEPAVKPPPLAPLPRQRHRWWAAAGALAGATALATALIVRDGAGQEPQGRPAPAPVVKSPPSSSAAARSTAPATPLPVVESLSATMNGAAGRTRDRDVTIFMSGVGSGIEFDVKLPERNCHVALPGEATSTVIKRSGGRWLRIYAVQARPGTWPAGGELRIPVDFEIERGVGAPPTGDVSCK